MPAFLFIIFAKQSVQSSPEDTYSLQKLVEVYKCLVFNTAISFLHQQGDIIRQQEL